MRQADRENTCAEIVELAARLTDVPDAVLRLTEWAGRGYPSGGDNPGRTHGGSPTETAIDGRDTFARELLNLDYSLISARNALREAVFCVARSKPIAVEGGEAWCRNHLQRLGARSREPIHRRDLCRFCSDFLRAEGRLPTAGILDARARGRRITQPLVDRELGRAS